MENREAVLMLNIAGKILDITDDPNGTLLKQASREGVSIPAFVMTAPAPTTRALEALPDHLFGFVDRGVHGECTRKYACDTPANTWMSGLYFLKHGDALPEGAQKAVAAKLADFYQIHGLEMPTLITKIASGTEGVPVAYESAHGPIDEDMFALTSTARPQYPIVTWDNVKVANVFFRENWMLFDPDHRREYCVKLAKRVRQLTKKAPPKPEKTCGMEHTAAVFKHVGKDPARALDPLVQIYASGVPDDDRIKVAFFKRLRIMKNQEKTALYDTYRMLFDNRGSYGLDKFAQALENIDREADLARFWNKGLDDPYRAILKVAEDPDSAVVFDENGLTVTAGQIKKLAGNRPLLAQHFEKDIVEGLGSDPVVVFDSLPSPEKLAMAALAAKC